MIIADTHIGKKWRSNIPLERLGDREECQNRAFRSAFEVAHGENVYHLGDLFDSWNVANDDLMFVAGVLRDWSSASPNNVMKIIAGNHDLSRSGKISSWHLLREICADCRNIDFIDSVKFDPTTRELFLPFSYTKSCADMVEDVIKLRFVPTLVYCHADFTDADVLNKLPAAHVYSGHLHNLRPKNVLGKVEFVRSMLPLNHYEAIGTEFDGMLYKTFPTAEELYISDENNHDRCVKVIVHDDEIMPTREEIDAMQVIIVRADEESAADAEVEVGEFDSRAVFDDCMSGVDSELKEEIWGLYSND